MVAGSLLGKKRIIGLNFIDGWSFDGVAGDGGGIGGNVGDRVFCCCGEDDGAAEAAAEQAGQLACLGVSLHCVYGVIKIAATGFQDVFCIEMPLAVAASAVIEAEICDAKAVEGFGQGDLFGRVAVGQEAVATDDEWGVRCMGEVQGAGELDVVCGEMDVVLGRHIDTLQIL